MAGLRPARQRISEAGEKVTPRIVPADLFRDLVDAVEDQQAAPGLERVPKNRRCQATKAGGIDPRSERVLELLTAPRAVAGQPARVAGRPLAQLAQEREAPAERRRQP